MTKQQCKVLLIGFPVVVVSYVLRSIVTSATQMAYYEQQAVRTAQGQKANEPVRVAPSPAATASVRGGAAQSMTFPPGGLASRLNLPGHWVGRAFLPGRGICALQFELRETNDAPGRYAGYSSLACQRVPALMAPQGRASPPSSMMSQMNPTSAILSGTMENGSIHFRVDQTIDPDTRACAATSFLVSPFGMNRIAVQWQERNCPGGQMILQRTRP
jgi:hypothetical protein